MNGSSLMCKVVDSVEWGLCVIAFECRGNGGGYGNHAVLRFAAWFAGAIWPFSRASSSHTYSYRVGTHIEEYSRLEVLYPMYFFSNAITSLL